ncbi:VCBS domain-containing protein [Ramlibacter sp. PS4R-6]|uniref:VCBS domain-containing protein n=1 Tax=Ramlibacter sp. PS4R-6 TaxID=3133438 RepID=UPI00309DFCD3
MSIDGRLVAGATLQAWAVGGVTGLQWQVLANGVWTNVGAAGSATFTIPANAVGRAYRVAGTGPEGTVYSPITGSVAAADSKKASAPVLSGTSLSVLATEGAGPIGVFGGLTFSDADKGNYGGGSLLLQDSTSTVYGGDGHDLLAIRFAGTGLGQFSYNAATREVKYAFTAGVATTIGTLDAALDGNGTDLKVTFNANATQAVVDKLIDNLQVTNTDDSPTDNRLVTLRITDPTGESAQRVTSIHIEGEADAPVITSPAAFAIDEDQAAVGTVAAYDPDREAGAPQGITYSLVSGAGSADNALFSIDAATGALRFVTAPDFEGAHAPSYSVRVRASDGNGGATDQVLAVTVRDVNNEPVASNLQATVSEDGPSVLIAANATDPTPGDTLTYAIDAAGTRGNVTLEGASFRYDPTGRFEMLKAGASAQDTFKYTVTDAAGHAVNRTVTVTVQGANDAPIAVSPFGIVTEAGAAGAGTAVFADTIAAFDVDGEAVTFSLAGQGTYGSLQLTSDGHWTYVLDNANAAVQALGDFGSLQDTIAVDVRDPQGAVTPHQVRVMIWGANDAPVVSGSQVALAPLVEAGAGVAGVRTSAGSVAASASDPEGDALTWVAGTQQGQWGALTLDAAGNWHYDLDDGRTDPLTQGQRVGDTFTVQVRDSHGASGTRTLSFDVQGTNDAAVIGGASEGHVLEDMGATLHAGGVLTVSDPDAGQSQLVARSGAAGSAGGVFDVAADGTWSYAIDNAAAVVQSLGEGDTLVDTLTVTSIDGTAEQVLSVTLHGVNDAAQFTGTTTLIADEDSFDAAGHLVLDADMGLHDADAGENAVQPNSGTGSGQFGQFNVDAAGHWTWSSQANPWTIESLAEGQTLTDMFGAFTTDGTFSLLQVVVAGRNDDPIIAMGDTTGQVIEPGGFPPEMPPPPTTATGSLMAWDKDNGDTLTWSSQGDGQYGSFTVDATGHWTYVVDAVKSDPLAMGQSAVDTVYATVSDGHGGSATQAIAITVYGGNETPVIDPSSTLTATVHELPAPNGTLVIDRSDGSGYAGLIAADPAGGLVVLSDVEQFPGYTIRTLSHFNPDGSLDTDYGQGGQAIFNSPISASSLQVDAQGRAVAVGYTLTDYGNARTDAAVMRVLADGSLDNSFGTGGVVALDFGGSYDYGYRAYFAADGKLLVTLSGGGSDMAPVVARLNENGSLDTSFGTGGVLQVPRGSFEQQVSVDVNGRIYLSAAQWNEGTYAYELHVQRFLSDGTADASFGDAGAADVALPASSIWGTSLTVGSDGRIILSSTVPGDGLQHAHAMLTALNADGSLDESFGAGGTLHTQVWPGLQAVQLDAQGRILVAGQPAGYLGNTNDFMVARYLADGSVDTSFGTNGATVTDISGAGRDDFVMQLTLGADGTILLAGATSESTYGWDPAAARYTADGQLDATFGVGIEQTVTGIIEAHDPDPFGGGWQPLQFTAVNEGAYGDFKLMSPQYGYWTYTVDSQRAAALDEGETATDTITVAIRDAFGGVTYQDVVVTVVGSWDPPQA